MNGISTTLGVSSYKLSAIISGYDRQISSSLEKLSTGLRVNSAIDDADSYFRARDLQRLSSSAKDTASNLEDHLSRLQTAEDAMTTISDLLDQMETLAKEASTETSQSVRASKGAEYDELRKAIDTVVNTTRYKGDLILKGAYDTDAGGSGISAQVGEEATDTYNYEILDTRATSSTGLKLSSSSAETAWGNADSATGMAAASASVDEIATDDSGRTRLERNINRLSTHTLVISGSQSSLESRMSNYEAARSALVGVDDAEESSLLTSLQIRQQAAASFLAQSNVSRASVISYLSGFGSS